MFSHHPVPSLFLPPCSECRPLTDRSTCRSSRTAACESVWRCAVPPWRTEQGHKRRSSDNGHQRATSIQNCFRLSRNARALHPMDEVFHLAANGKHLGINSDKLVGAHVRAAAVFRELLLRHKWEAESLNVILSGGNTVTWRMTASYLPVRS